MRILLLTPQLPYPPHQGTSLRNYHIIRGLALQHELHLLSFVEDTQQATPEVLAPLHELCASVTLVPVPGRTRRQRLARLLVRNQPDMAHRLESHPFDVALRQLLSQWSFDVVQVEGIELARVIPLVRLLAPASKLVFDDHNAEAALQQRAFLTDVRQPGRWPAAAYSVVQSERLRHYERWACRAADAVTVVSEADREALRELVPGLRATVIPNCIDVARYREAVTGTVPDYDLLFTGKMDYRPNVDAMLWFGREIWPLIRAGRPQATWAVVGQNPHPRLDWLGEEEGVTLTGRVPEIRPYFAGARVYVMPLRMGSGTRLKLIEALASEKAIVSTTLGSEGFPVIPNQHLLLADSPGEFADAVLHLLDHPEQRARLGQAAGQLAGRYDWRQVIPRFEAVYGSLSHAR